MGMIWPELKCTEMKLSRGMIWPGMKWSEDEMVWDVGQTIVPLFGKFGKYSTILHERRGFQKIDANKSAGKECISVPPIGCNNKHPLSRKVTTVKITSPGALGTFKGLSKI